MTSVAIIGPGAVGGAIAAWLSRNPTLDISLCARTSFARLEVETPAGTLTANPPITTDPASAGPVDWVLIATKAYDAEAAGRWIAPLLGAQTRVAVLQNGVEHIARFAPYVETARIVPVVVDLPAERVAPGIIRQRRAGSLIAPRTENGALFAALFSGTDFPVALVEDFTTALWRKLCVNCAGAVFVVTQKPAGIARRDDVAALMRGLMRECIAVGAAEGASIEDAFPDAVIAGYRAGPAQSLNSMLADRLAGRPLEVDARNGVIVRLGAKHGLATPLNGLMVTLLAASAS